VYLRFDTKLDCPVLARLLNPSVSDDSIDWDYENVYEWMWLDLIQFDFVLNISREHGDADVDDGTFATPGSTFVNAWSRGDRYRVDKLPDSLAQFLANQLNVDIAVFAGTLNVDIEDGPPIRIISSGTNRGITM
jgi:hypothetical protein